MSSALGESCIAIFSDRGSTPLISTTKNTNREALDKDDRFSALYRLPAINEFYSGQIFYFLMLSIAYEGELANVDAYDQPGVEAYKKIIKRELGR